MLMLFIQAAFVNYRLPGRLSLFYILITFNSQYRLHC